MARVSLEKLAPGMRLDKPVFNLHGVLLLKTCEVLTERHLGILRAWGVREVDVLGGGGTEPGPTADPTPSSEILEAVQAEIHPLFRRAEATTDPVMAEILRVATLHLARRWADQAASGGCRPASARRGVMTPRVCAKPKDPRGPRTDGLDRLIQQICSLPTLPTVLLRVSEMVNNPKTSALQLSRVILDDQALTARLLRLVNSPFFGFPQRIATVTEAITILGFQQVRNLLLTTSVVGLLGADETAWFSPTTLWEHSIGTAVAAGLIARYTRHEDREELFVAGLLHDVGKLVEFQLVHEEFLDALALAVAEDIPVHIAEQRVLGFNHNQAGCLLAEQWRLPARLTETLAAHHQPDLAPAAKREAAIVHLADILCRALSLGSGGDDAVPPLNGAAWERLRLPLTVLEPLMAELDERHGEALAILRAPQQARPKRAGHLAHVR